MFRLSLFQKNFVVIRRCATREYIGEPSHVPLSPASLLTISLEKVRADAWLLDSSKAAGIATMHSRKQT
jgi:hypothetical protein